MSKLQVGETYRGGTGDKVKIVFHDTDCDLYVGWDCGPGVHRSYAGDGSCVGEFETHDLIIPPQLPWEWIVGDWYLRRNGDAVECTVANDHAVKFRDGKAVFSKDGTRQVDASEDPHDIVAHLGPLPRGVYHTSDGDTQLLADLKRWQERGGNIQAKGFGYSWVTGHGNEPARFDSKDLLYRAHGCTDDREFPKPAKTQTGPYDRHIVLRDMFDLAMHLNDMRMLAFFRDLTAKTQPEPQTDPLGRVVTIRDMLAWGKSCERAETFFTKLAESQP